MPLNTVYVHAEMYCSWLIGTPVILIFIRLNSASSCQCWSKWRNLKYTVLMVPATLPGVKNSKEQKCATPPAVALKVIYSSSLISDFVSRNSKIIPFRGFEEIISWQETKCLICLLNLTRQWSVRSLHSKQQFTCMYTSLAPYRKNSEGRKLQSYYPYPH